MLMTSSHTHTHTFQRYVLGTNPEMNDVIGYCNNMRNQDGMPVDGGLESYLCWGMTKAEVQAAVLAGQPGVRL